MADTRKRLPLFGGITEVVLYDVDEVLGTVYIDLIHQEARRLQRIFNFYNPESELSLLNKWRRARCSEELALVLKKALELCAETDGRYDVTHGKAFLARKQGEPVVTPTCSYHDVMLNGREIHLLNREVLLDLGSIAKGFITDQLLQYIRGLGIESALVNARGDIGMYGVRKELIDIRHPREQQSVIGTISLRDHSIATTGDYNQYVESFKRSHLLGSTDLISVSVVAPKLMEADAIATALFLIGSKETEHFLASRPHIRVLTIDDSLRTRRYNGFETLEIRMQITTGGTEEAMAQ